MPLLCNLSSYHSNKDLFSRVFMFYNYVVIFPQIGFHISQCFDWFLIVFYMEEILDDNHFILSPRLTKQSHSIFHYEQAQCQTLK